MRYIFLFLLLTACTPALPNYQPYCGYVGDMEYYEDPADSSDEQYDLYMKSLYEDKNI